MELISYLPEGNWFEYNGLLYERLLTCLHMPEEDVLWRYSDGERDVGYAVNNWTSNLVCEAMQVCLDDNGKSIGSIPSFVR